MEANVLNVDGQKIMVISVPLVEHTLEDETMSKDMPVLNFTTWVLGDEAAGRLKAKQVTQTIRSDKEAKHLKTNIEVTVALDGFRIDEVYIESLVRRQFSSLNIQDAQCGGFTSLDELRAAAKRAGYRWKPFEEYSGNAIRFSWLPS